MNTYLAVLITINICGAAKEPKALVLDTPASAYQKPYHPEHGSTPDVNPPPFVWVPVKGAKGYAIQIAKKEDFAGESLRTIADIAWTVFVPDEPMAAGQWWWRYGAKAADGKLVWSKPRRFIVTADAKESPAPNIEKLVVKIPKQRPRLFIPSPQLESYRARAKTDFVDTIKSVRRGCDKHIGEELVAEPEHVTKRKGPYRGQHYRQIFVRTRPPMNLMETCGLVYLLTGDKKYGNEAKRRILHFFRWDPKGSTSYRANDEPAMWVMMRGTRAYDWTYDLFTPAERAEVEACMRIRAKQFFDHLRGRKFASNPYASHSNRTLGFLGEAAMSFAHEWPEAREWLRYVTQVYWGIFPAWGGPDGGWQEGPGYWNAYMSFALYFVTALKQASGHNIAEKTFFQNTPYYAIYTNPPYAGHSPFGDGQAGRPGKRRGNLLYWFSTLTRNPHARWYAEAKRSGPGNNILGVVLRDPSIKPKRPTDIPQARLFESVGLVAMHSKLGFSDKDAYLLMRSSPYGGISHGHANQNAIVVEAFGQQLAIASGHYPWYSSPHHKDWTRQTKASCSITFDGGTGQVARDRSANGKITHFLDSPAFHFAVGDATAAYKGRLKRFLRKIVHVRPGVFVVFDDVAAPKPVTWEWWLHSVVEMEIDAPARSVRVDHENAHMDVRWLAPSELAYAQTGKFDPPPERDVNWQEQWHLTASTKAKSDATCFLTVLWPWKDHAPAADAIQEIEHPSVSACEVVDKGRRNILAFRAADVPRAAYRVGPVETDAASVAVRLGKQNQARYYMVEDATMLNVGGACIFKASVPTTRAAAVEAAGNRD